MNVKKLIAETMVIGGLGLPAIGLGIGMANAKPPVPWVPGCRALTLPGGCQIPGATAPTVPVTIVAPAQPVSAATMANGNDVAPTIRATPYGGGVVPGRNRTGAGLPTPLFGNLSQLFGIGRSTAPANNRPGR